MKIIRDKKGPFNERPYYTQDEIEEICAGELKKTGLYPVTPGPVRIERFIEKRFGVSPTYEELPEGVLAYTGFDSQGVHKVVVSTKLIEHGNQVAERRLNATLAHEAGHGLLHAHLFAIGSQRELLFGEAAGKNKVKVLCREESIGVQSGYDGRWWEYQANRAIGSLLLPKSLVGEALKPLLVARGSFGRLFLSEEKRDAAVRSIAAWFEVNSAVARIRITELYPKENEEQLTL
ncbi:MAG: hypothetical protein MN733_42595 [Nitrososphaera sp.]|nr:hypothetical protein [Nitrososphaera sp.]